MMCSVIAWKTMNKYCWALPPPHQNIFAFDEGERFLIQSKLTFLEFLRGIHRYKFGLPKKFFRGEIILGKWRNFHRARALFLAGVKFTFCLASWCASLSSLTFSSHLVCFLVEFWTVLPCSVGCLWHTTVKIQLGLFLFVGTNCKASQ